MELVLNAKELRVLGSLIEKELSTPDYYPLSLNALTNACNQKSNRDPVVSYDEETVLAVIDALDEKGLVWKSTVGRVPKYEERLTRDRQLVARESAVLCVLFLRGPQTAGAIRTRTARLCTFDTLDEVHETLGHLEEWGLAKRLARLPGHKESRYGHLFSGDPETSDPKPEADNVTDSDSASHRLEQLELDMQTLREELEDLKAELKSFKKQFE